MMDFHEGLSSPHPWQSHPAGWIIQFRPTSFYFERKETGSCMGSSCVDVITSVGNPLIWWGGVIALCYAIWRLIVKRDSLGMVLAAGTLAGWLPWEPYAHRTIFTFYSVAMVPFVVLTLTWALKHLAQPDSLGGQFARLRAFAVGWFIVAVLALSAFFYPVWTAETIPEWYRRAHVWLTTW